ncbi:MAG TPA: MBL fold metallo-hydrolase [Hyphomicrobiales bacterium]|nr:MBL fold metallo-hydrolase [Hyphomicrobiales bacterium]
MSRGSLVLFLSCLLWQAGAQAADAPPVTISPVAGKVYMISGGTGANVSVLAGEGEALLVDAKGPAEAEAIRTLVRQVAHGDVRYLINGHEHPDHTDGNAGFGASGALIIAHQGVREVLEAGQRGGLPAPIEALPVLTFGDGESLTLHFAGETVRLIAAPPAHSPSNIIVYFEQSNVLHLGDLFGPERYPVMAGGTLDGLIIGDEMALALADADTKVVAGIGALADVAQLRAYVDMLKTVRSRVADLIAQGKSLEEVNAAGVTAEFDATWGDASRFVPAVYQQLAQP